MRSNKLNNVCNSRLRCWEKRVKYSIIVLGRSSGRGGYRGHFDLRSSVNHEWHLRVETVHVLRQDFQENCGCVHIAAYIQTSHKPCRVVEAMKSIYGVYTFSVWFRWVLNISIGAFKVHKYKTLCAHLNECCSIILTSLQVYKSFTAICILVIIYYVYNYIYLLYLYTYMKTNAYFVCLYYICSYWFNYYKYI